MKLGISALLLVSVIVIGSVNCGVKDLTDDVIYEVMYRALLQDHPQEQANCIIQDLRENRLADKFYTVDILVNNQKIARDIQPYADRAELKCTLVVFFQSALGIAVLVTFFLLIIGLICWLVRCICRC